MFIMNLISTFVCMVEYYSRVLATHCIIYSLKKNYLLEKNMLQSNFLS